MLLLGCVNNFPGTSATSAHLQKVPEANEENSAKKIINTTKN